MLPKIKERFLFYPVVFILIGTFLTFKYPEIMHYSQTMGHSGITILFYFAGYVYGTISLLIRVRDFKVLLIKGLILITKAYFSIYLIPFALVLFVIELFIIIINKVKYMQNKTLYNPFDIKQNRHKKLKNKINKILLQEYNINDPTMSEVITSKIITK